MIVGIICCNSTTVSAINSVDQECATVESVFARGSGDSGNVGLDDVTTKFKDEIDRSSKSLSISQQFYALGTEPYNNYRYPHVAIKGFEDGGYANGFGAVVSSGENYTYGESVDTGIGEFIGYLQQRMANCPDAKYIVGGYSQGAQVVDGALPLLSESERDKITYVALFGNPKLHLPEAHSFEAYRKDPSATDDPLPDSCYGINLSPWHNVIDDCLAYSGKLYTDKTYDPYPSDIQARVHDWCFKEDGICDGEKESWGAGHTKYADYTGVPRAVDEALFASGLPPKPSFINLADPSMRYDIIFEAPMQCSPLFNFSDSVPPSLALPYAIQAISGIDKQVYVAWEYPYDLGIDEGYISDYASTIWRENTEHIRYRISEVNCASQYANQSFARKSLASVQEDHQKDEQPSMKSLTLNDPLTDFNNTTVLTEKIDDPACLTSTKCIKVDSLNSVLTSPPPIYPAIKNITNLINRTVSYKLSQSSPLSMYDTYLWDVNADGYTDITTSVPSLSYAYPYSYDGQLRVTALSSANGLSASTEFNVNILTSYKAPTRPLAPIGLTVKKLSNDSVSVSWARDPADTVTAGWLIRVDNFPIARATLPTTLLTITDMHFEVGESRTITVAGLTSSELEGAQTSVTVPASLPDNEVVETEIPTNSDTITGSSASQKKESTATFDLNRPVVIYKSSLAPSDADTNVLPALTNIGRKVTSVHSSADAGPNDNTQPTPWMAIITLSTIIVALLSSIRFRK
jgi:hypothetical protein